MPMGKGTYGSKRGRPRGSKQLKQPNMKGRKGPGNMFKKVKKVTGAVGPRGKNMKKSYGR